MFVSCTTLLYDSTAATQILKLSTTHGAFLVKSIWFFFWWCPLLSVDCFRKLCLSGNSTENSQVGWDLGNRMARGYRFDAKWVCPMGSYAWGIQVFCSVREMRRYQCSLFASEISLLNLKFSHVDSLYDKSHCSPIRNTMLGNFISRNTLVYIFISWTYL